MKKCIQWSTLSKLDIRASNCVFISLGEACSDHLCDCSALQELAIWTDFHCAVGLIELETMSLKKSIKTGNSIIAVWQVMHGNDKVIKIITIIDDPCCIFTFNAQSLREERL